MQCLRRAESQAGHHCVTHRTLPIRHQLWQRACLGEGGGPARWARSPAASASQAARGAPSSGWTWPPVRHRTCAEHHRLMPAGLQLSIHER